MNLYRLHTSKNLDAPPQFAWSAWFGDYDHADDYTTPTGNGATEEEAIVDLVQNHDLPRAPE